MKKTFYPFLLLLLCSFYAHTLRAQIITTVAGAGTAAFFGDGGAATISELNLPLDVQIGRGGALYIADYLNNRIRKINTSGIITTFAGGGTGGLGDGGPATGATLDGPDGVAFDAGGNVYIADYSNNLIRRVNTAGMISTFAGGGLFTAGEDIPATAAALNGPADVAVDASGNVYIADAGNNLVRIVNTLGIINVFAGGAAVGMLGDGGPATAASLNYPSTIAIDVSGNVYIADVSNNRVRKVNTAGIITTIAGGGTGGLGDGGPATAATLNAPDGIAFDGSGNIYIADGNNNRIRKVNTSGVITTIAGGGTGGLGDGGFPVDATLFSPAGICFDSCSNMYIADAANNRIRKVGGPALTSSLTPPAICDTAVFSYTPVSASSASYTWMRVAVPGISNPSASGAGSPGEVLTNTTDTPVAVTYNYTVSSASGCSSISLVTVTVDPLPAAGTITGAAYICAGNTASLHDAVPGGSWSSGNTLATISATGIVTGESGGAGSIIYTFTNACGSAHATYPITVYAAGDCPSYVPAVLVTTTTVNVYPNPNGGAFTLLISSPANEQATVTITNMVGEQVGEYMVAANEVFDIKSEWPDGIYFLSVVVAGNKYAGKIQIMGR